MSAQNFENRPSFGATFYPGRDDDYLMPTEVVSPSPQRVMPEVPVQIAGSLETLELEANSVVPHRAQAGYIPQQGNRIEPQQHRMYSDTSRRSGEYRDSNRYQDSIPPPVTGDYPQYNDYGEYMAPMEEPVNSPFPRLVNPGPNVPPTFEQKEAMVEQARVEVLSSNDPELQLAWAQDALNFVEISLAHIARITEGDRYDSPELEHQIKTDSINVVSFLADQQHPRAEFMRGNWLEFGKFGFRIDKKDAFRCYARAAEKGYARAEYRMGMQYENSNEPMKAIKHYTQGAALGDSASNYRLGMMTLLGQHGQKQDYARGVHLIRLAAQSADENAPQGAYVYGMLLARELPGITVPDLFLPQDQRLAREMIERAAYLGFARAQLKMGTAYELCQLGCEFNPALSLHYNSLAARQGEPEAEMAISKWFLCGHEGIFDKNEELAFLYAQRAAQSGLATAEFALGYFYEIGMYVQVDLQEAQRWYAKAAAHGNKDASGRIDGISRSKTLSRRDHENIAISKIKARHGSQRQKVNPITERQRAAQPPTISETLEMPDPTIPQDGGAYDSGVYSPPMPTTKFPPRKSSAAPQINTSFINPDILAGQPHLNPYGPMSAIVPQRPGTTAPYPLEDRPMTVGGHQPFIRPGSAASFVNPQSRPFSPPGGNQFAQGGPLPQRPSTTQPGVARPGPGRPYPGPQQQLQHHASLNRQDSTNSVYSQRPDNHVYPGFEADVQPRPNRNSGGKSTAPGMGPKPGSVPPTPGLGYEAPPLKPMTPKPPAQPQKKPLPQGRPPPSPAPSAPTTVAPKPAPPQAPPVQPTSPKPPGKGPKTFEEMGVPTQKKEEECTIM